MTLITGGPQAKSCVIKGKTLVPLIVAYYHARKGIHVSVFQDSIPVAIGVLSKSGSRWVRFHYLGPLPLYHTLDFTYKAPISACKNVVKDAIRLMEKPC